VYKTKPCQIEDWTIWAGTQIQWNWEYLANSPNSDWRP